MRLTWGNQWRADLCKVTVIDTVRANELYEICSVLVSQVRAQNGQLLWLSTNGWKELIDINNSASTSDYTAGVAN
jgi:hypothetical protein